MTLHQLKVFLTVAKLKSYTLAAEKLRVRQPSVTLLVQGLERELKIKLFERLGNKIHLTRAGEELLLVADEIVGKAAGLKERVDEIKGLKKGKIAVGGSGIATATFLPLAVQSFKKEHAGIEVVLRIQRSDELERQLLSGELDLAILGRAPSSPLLLAEPYRDEEVSVIAPPDHPLAQMRLVSLALIAKEPLITYEKGTHIRDMVEARFSEAGIPFVPRLEVDHQLGARDAVKGTVAGGLGIGFLTKSHVVFDVKAGRLKMLKVPELNLKRTMYIAVHKNRKAVSLVQTLIDFLRRYNHQI